MLILLVFFKISSLIIEGHTDQDNRKTSDERKLSANRAISVFIAIEKRESLISALSNSNNEKIFGYGGYGRERPIIENAKKEEQKSKNRRIEFRFILEPPKDNIIVQLINNES